MKTLITLLFFIQTSLLTASETKVFYVSGEVKLKRNDENIVLKKGMEILEGDLVKTNEKSFAILKYANKSTFKVDPKTELQFDELHFKVPGTKKKSTSLLLKAGSVMIDFYNPKKDKKIEVRARDVAMGVRGTHFVAAIDDNEDKDVYLIVREGTVNLYDYKNDDYDQVTDGETSLVRAGNKIQKPTKFAWIKTLNWDMKTQSASAKSSFFNSFVKENRAREIQAKKDIWSKRAKRSIKADQPKEIEERKLRKNRIINKQLIRKNISEMKQGKVKAKKAKQIATDKINSLKRKMKKASASEKKKIASKIKAIKNEYNKSVKTKKSIHKAKMAQNKNLKQNINENLARASENGEVRYKK